jgi:hypothetical protein
MINVFMPISVKEVATLSKGERARVLTFIKELSVMGLIGDTNLTEAITLVQIKGEAEPEPESERVAAPAKPAVRLAARAAAPAPADPTDNEGHAKRGRKPFIFPVTGAAKAHITPEQVILEAKALGIPTDNVDTKTLKQLVYETLSVEPAAVEPAVEAPKPQGLEAMVTIDPMLSH